ncbi:conserved hypothetical protein [Trichinella spiralis]|uniref:hypothetical protein n=1 Tax=Trichinella spiralis TaxID=6334 RepID=UPI0001EFEC58|nr:conserved hypothetical protein [Trichinella spiralis]
MAIITSFTCVFQFYISINQSVESYQSYRSKNTTIDVTVVLLNVNKNIDTPSKRDIYIHLIMKIERSNANNSRVKRSKQKMLDAVMVK